MDAYFKIFGLEHMVLLLDLRRRALSMDVGSLRVEETLVLFVLRVLVLVVCLRIAIVTVARAVRHRGVWVVHLPVLILKVVRQVTSRTVTLSRTAAVVLVLMVQDVFLVVL
jgi:hypothetical protein